MYIITSNELGGSISIIIMTSTLHNIDYFLANQKIDVFNQKKFSLTISNIGDTHLLYKLFFMFYELRFSFSKDISLIL